MTIHSYIMAAAALIFLTAAAAQVISPDCIPDQFEIDFMVTVLKDSKLAKGFGRIHCDNKVSNVTVMNITMVGEEATKTALYISDTNANRTYLLDLSTGLCTAQLDTNDANFTNIFSAYLGAGEEKLDINIFESNSDLEKITLIVTKKLCIPIHATYTSDISFKLVNFFNATIGIENPDVFGILDKCKAA